MATLSSPGIGSGLDVAGIVSKLVAVEQRPLQLLQTRATTAQSKISALGQLKAQLDTLRTAASNLASATSWSAKAATLSDPKIGTVTATASAPTATYSLEVTHLALPHRIASGPVASGASVVGTGTLTIAVGTWAGAVHTPASGTTPVTITVDATNNTLEGVRDAINAAGGGVTANIVTDTSGARLVLSSGTTGSSGAISVTAVDADGTHTDSSGLSALAYGGDTTPTAPGLKQVQAAQDAQLYLDGLKVVSSTNTVTGAIDGVTLTLASTNAGSPATLKLAPDAAGASSLVNKFVAAYNATVNMLGMLTKTDPKGVANGILQGDQAARGIGNALRSLATRVLPTGELTSLSQAGISLNKDGTLSVNDAKLQAAGASGTAALAALFGAAGETDAPDTQGIAVRLKAALDAALGTEGSIAARTQGLESTLKSNQREQAAMSARITALQARLTKQYGALDTIISNMNTASSSLTQGLAQIANISKQISNDG